MYKTALPVAMISAALVCVAVPATAHADETSFLNRVHAAGMPLTDDKALKLGHATCTDLGKGIPESAVLAANNPEVGDGPHLTDAQNRELLSAAVAELCPQVRSGH